VKTQKIPPSFRTESTEDHIRNTSTETKMHIFFKKLVVLAEKKNLNKFFQAEKQKPNYYVHVGGRNGKGLL